MHAIIKMILILGGNMKKVGFDNELYVKKQVETIKERIKMFDNK